MIFATAQHGNMITQKIQHQKLQNENKTNEIKLLKQAYSRNK